VTTISPTILPIISFAIFPTNSSKQYPTYYQSYHYAMTNHPQPSPIPQIIYPSSLPQITYPTPSNPTHQNKAEPYLPPPHPLQIREPLQQSNNFLTHDTIHTIIGGCNADFENKRQQRVYYRQVNHVVVKGPMIKTKWSHMPITFYAEDIYLASFPHTDTMVITVHIDKWYITRILIDNGSQVKVLLLSAFDKMGYDRK
jgi:hypothetical protein